MRACVRLDDRVYSRWFALKEGLRQGCVLAPLLFNIFFAAVRNVVINAASTRFEGGRRHHGRFGTPEEKKGGGEAGGSDCRRISSGDADLGMPYADDARVASRSPEQLKKMMEVIVVVCAAFGLTVS